MIIIENIIYIKMNEIIKQQYEINDFNNKERDKNFQNIYIENKEYFDANPKSYATECNLCMKFKIYPIDFEDDYGEKYERKFKRYRNNILTKCCIDCFQDEKYDKDEFKTYKKVCCPICNSIYTLSKQYSMHLHLYSKKCQDVIKRIK